jgi:putative oligomerization/nucleic acid binding protein
MEGPADSTPEAPGPPPQAPGATQADPAAEAKATPGASRARRIWARILLFIATLLTVISIFAVWANRQVLNADHWSDTSTALLQNNAIRTQLSTYLVDQVYANVNVSRQLSTALPPRLQPLAGPISGGLRNLAERAAFEILSRPRVQTAWRAANKVTAQQFINIVEDKSRLVQLNGNAVFVDLRPIIGDLASQIGLPASLTDKIPSDAGRLKVMTADQISTVQNGVDLLKGIAIFAPILALLLFALAVYLYTGRRRHTLWIIGIDLVIAGLLVIIVRNFAGHQIVNSLVKDDAVKPAAQATWSIGTRLLSDVGQSVVLIGLAVMLSAALAGPRRPAVWFRRVTAPWLRERRVICYGAALALLLLLVWWEPIPALRMPIPVLIILGLLWLGVEALRRQTMEEFPDAELGDPFASLKGQSDRFTAWLRDRRQPESSPPPAIAASASASARAAGLPLGATGGDADRLSRLERLAALRDSGALSDEEFAAEKRALLGGV